MKQVTDNQLRSAFRQARGDVKNIAKRVKLKTATVQKRLEGLPAAALELERLWVMFDATQGLEVRNELVSRYYSSTIKYMRKVCGRLPNQMTIDDVRGEVHEALIKCVNGYDLDLGTAFMTWAGRRIAGAVKDAMRDMDWASRLQRTALNRMERAASQFVGQHGRRPSTEEWEQLVDEKTLTRCKLKAMVQSLDHVLFERAASGRQLCVIDTVAAPQKHKPDDFFEEMARGLGIREQTVFYLYYCCGVYMKTIGDMVGLSETRVSQIMDAVNKRLRSRGHNMAADAFR